MTIRIDTAKNAFDTCVVDGRFLHSKYNPENEAKKFIESIQCAFTPSCIILTGSCLHYPLKQLQKRFSSTPLFAICYDAFFVPIAQPYVTHTFLCTSNTTKEDFAEDLFSCVGEVQLSSALILSWKSAEAIFTKESAVTWAALKISLQKARDIIATRSYFSMRWLKNSIKFCTRVNHVVEIQKQTKPILIVASGPSLSTSLKHIKKHKKAFYIIALSSALCTLTENDIIPNLCISTDGGFYAQHHIKKLFTLQQKGISIPLLASIESNIPADVLEHCNVVPLQYSDGVETALIKTCGIPTIVAERNGTVSGTACILALHLTDEKVFICGLDLANGRGYSHSQPNAHEKINSQTDNKLQPLETRITRSSALKTDFSALDIYRQWFETRDSTIATRLSRLADESYTFSNKLGLIKDCTWQHLTLDIHTGKKDGYLQKTILPREKRQNYVYSFIKKEKMNPSKEFIEHSALAELIHVQKYPDSIDAQKKLIDKVNKHLTKLEELLP